MSCTVHRCISRIGGSVYIYNLYVILEECFNWVSRLSRIGMNNQNCSCMRTYIDVSTHRVRGRRSIATISVKLRARCVISFENVAIRFAEVDVVTGFQKLFCDCHLCIPYLSQTYPCQYMFRNEDSPFASTDCVAARNLKIKL